MLTAVIPPPPFDHLPLGPLQPRLYGIMIALGVVAAVSLGRRRWAAAGHDPEQVSSMALWAVPAGLVGTRVYHVITDYSSSYCGAKCGGYVFWDAFKIWNGGLGIPGGILAGVGAGLLYARSQKIPWRDLADAVIPGLPLAQAIGRWGNYFNQELFGRPTTLPWALRVEEGVKDKVPGFETYHPTFLYESLWNLVLVGVLIAVDRTKRLGRGKLLGVYLMGYWLGRLWIERLRIDRNNSGQENLLFGLRTNVWVSLLGIAIGVGVLLYQGVANPPRQEVSEEGDATTGDDLAVTESAGGDSAAPDGLAVEGGPEAAVGPSVSDDADGGGGSAEL